MSLLCGTRYGCVGVGVCVLWWNERCDDFKSTILTDFFDGQIRSNSQLFRIAQSKKLESVKALSRLCKIDLVSQSKRAVFDWHIRLYKSWP